MIGCVASLNICIKLSLSQLSKLTTLMKVTKLMKLTTCRSQHATNNAGRSSAPAYIENEWQLSASAAQDAFGVSAQ